MKCENLLEMDKRCESVIFTLNESGIDEYIIKCAQCNHELKGKFIRT